MVIDFVDGGYEYAGVGAISVAGSLCADSRDKSLGLSPPAGIPTTEEQVSLLTRVVATESSPALDVLSVEPLGKQPMAEHSPARSRVRLGCHLPGKCLPFYAIVSGLEPPAGSRPLPPAPPPASTTRCSKANMDITMRAGTHATLVMDDDRSHIQVAVISLENGIAGHRIHVASPDHKQIYVGEVVNANLLRGSF